jgi:hypothetical protein
MIKNREQSNAVSASAISSSFTSNGDGDRGKLNGREGNGAGTIFKSSAPSPLEEASVVEAR